VRLFRVLVAIARTNAQAHMVPCRATQVAYALMRCPHARRSGRANRVQLTVIFLSALLIPWSAEVTREAMSPQRRRCGAELASICPRTVDKALGAAHIEGTLVLSINRGAVVIPQASTHRHGCRRVHDLFFSYSTGNTQVVAIGEESGKVQGLKLQMGFGTLCNNATSNPPLSSNHGTRVAHFKTDSRFALRGLRFGAEPASRERHVYWWTGNPLRYRHR
jgi:hypothetical protein